MKTIAQQLNIQDFPFEILDKKGNETYREYSDGFWWKRQHDSQGNQTYYENSDGYWEKREYDSMGNQTYYENSRGFWEKREYNSKGKETYFVNSKGFWRKREFDSNGKETYYADSLGTRLGTPSKSVSTPESLLKTSLVWEFYGREDRRLSAAVRTRGQEALQELSVFVPFLGAWLCASGDAPPPDTLALCPRSLYAIRKGSELHKLLQHTQGSPTG